uniref:Uncharacterized protein n=1 Tax=Trichogramma kaykai TaxID=54128 RepID=A0ABD2WGN5_9HYME
MSLACRFFGLLKLLRMHGGADNAPPKLLLELQLSKLIRTRAKHLILYSSDCPALDENQGDRYYNSLMIYKQILVKFNINLNPMVFVVC